MVLICTGNLFGFDTMNCTFEVDPGTSAPTTAVPVTDSSTDEPAWTVEVPVPVTIQAAQAAPAPPTAMTEAAMMAVVRLVILRMGGSSWNGFVRFPQRRGKLTFGALGDVVWRRSR